jgi:cytochrome bd-type quinol oxidase subunit 1
MLLCCLCDFHSITWLNAAAAAAMCHCDAAGFMTVVYLVISVTGYYVFGAGIDVHK